MSESTPPFPPALEWEPQVQPALWVIPPPRPRWWLYGLFLLLTLISTTVVGARLEFNFLHHQPAFSLSDDSLPLFPIAWIAQHPANLLLGLPFSLTLMVILLAHEMGHYLYAQHYRVYATPPVFVPCPYLSLFGTLGAFIRIKSSIPSRAALFDIGIAGPIAGFIPACVALVCGLSLSRPIAPALASATTEQIQLGFPLIFHLAARLLNVGVPLSALSLHPVAAAAWVGMFATALNLLPCGQLDGGHIVFSISPRMHHWISLLTIVAMVPIGDYLWLGWFIWAVLLTITRRHPRVPRNPEVSGGRRILGVCAALILVLTFTPAPLSGGSGQEAWQQIHEASKATLHDLHDGVEHLLHRK
jgi:Zn-dependent protease